MKYPAWVKQVFFTVAFVGGLLAWFAIYYVPARIDSQTNGMSRDVSSLKTDMGDVKGNVQRIDNTVIGMMKELLDAQLASLKGVNKLGTQVAKDRLILVASLVDKAKQAGIRADPAVVAQAGQDISEFINNSELRLPALNATQELLSYQSILVPKPVRSPLVQTEPLPKMWSTGVLPFTVSSITVYSWTLNLGDMAVFKGINEKVNESVRSGPALISLNGDDTKLEIDGHEAKNVIFNHLHIVYRGGPVVLTNVYFVDCTFDIPKSSPKAAVFARALFSSSPAKFTS